MCVCDTCVHGAGGGVGCGEQGVPDFISQTLHECCLRAKWFSKSWKHSTGEDRQGPETEGWGVCVRGREQCEERDESKQLRERERCEPLSERERFTGEAGGERRAGVREHLGALGVTVGV